MIKLKNNKEVSDIFFKKDSKKYAVSEILASNGGHVSSVYSSGVWLTYDTNYNKQFNIKNINRKNNIYEANDPSILSVLQYRGSTSPYAIQEPYVSNPNISNHLSVTSVVDDGSLTAVGEQSFRECSNLKSVSLPAVSSLASTAFFKCSALSSIYVDNDTLHSTENGYGEENQLVVTDDEKSLVLAVRTITQLSDDELTVIGPRALQYCDNLSSLDCSAVTRIQLNSFQGCKKLMNVSFPEATHIDNYAFNECLRLTSVSIPKMTYINNNAFNYCTKLSTVVLSSVTNVPILGGKNSFGAKRAWPVSVYIPYGMTDAFMAANNWPALVEANTVKLFDVDSGCTFIAYEDGTFESKLIVGELTQAELGDRRTDIKSVVIGTVATSIGEGAFSDCSALASVTIPEGVTSIGKRAFYGCTSLTNVSIPDSITIIPNSAFQNCSSLTDITIPSSIKQLASWVFYNCSSLSGVTIPDSVWYIGQSVFYGCSSLQSIEIPPSITRIDLWTFGNCSRLKSVTIPEGVTSIGGYAFSGCGGMIEYIVDEANKYYKSVNGLLLTKDGKELIAGVNGDVEIPDGVTCIYGVEATRGNGFYNCSKLSSVTIPASVTYIGYDSFTGTPNNLSATFLDRSISEITSMSNFRFGMSESATIIPGKQD